MGQDVLRAALQFQALSSPPSSPSDFTPVNSARLPAYPGHPPFCLHIRYFPKLISCTSNSILMFPSRKPNLWQWLTSGFLIYKTGTLIRVKKESEKAGLKLNIQKTKIMASRPTTSWHIDRERMETVTDFIFLGSQIAADGDWSHEIKRPLLLGRKVMTNLDSILKGRNITLPTKVYLIKAIAFPVVMYGCESWTIKKAECCRIDAFELRCWRRLLRVP